MNLKFLNNNDYVVDKDTTKCYHIDNEEIKEWLKDNTPEPEFTDEELQQIELNKKLQEANSYLSSTDWVKEYKLRHDLGLELIPETSSKWLVIAKREEYITFLKGL